MQCPLVHDGPLACASSLPPFTLPNKPTKPVQCSYQTATLPDTLAHSKTCYVCSFLPCQVGVITPYRSQRQLIRDALTTKLGATTAADVAVETVDSFQGKQMDVIILSLVRARGTAAAGASAGGVGFLADTRRMNVAITRAKQALWVVGNLRTLRGDPTWSALIEDASTRGMVLEDCTAANLYPEHVYPRPAAARGVPPGGGMRGGRAPYSSRGGY